MNAYPSSPRPSRIASLLAFCFSPFLLAEIDPAELKRTKSAATRDISAPVSSAGPLAPLGGPPLIGTYTVGVGGNINSLTNPGGVFDLLNQQGGFGVLTFNIISDLTAETGTVALGVVTSATSIVIKPSGASRIISGSNSTNLIRFEDTDNVTIEGSLTGGTASGVGGNPALRNLTILNTSATAASGAVVAVTEGTAGAQNFTIRNTDISGQAFDQTRYVLHIGGNAIGSGPQTASNNNSRVENCSFQKADTGIFNNGRSASPATGTVITMNDLSASGANRLRRRGIFFFHQNGIQVTANSVGNLVCDDTSDCIGIAAGSNSAEATSTVAGGISNALIAGNRIHAIVNPQPGSSAAGLAFGGTSPTNVIANNMITGVSAQSTSPRLTAGIFIVGSSGSVTRLYYNSVAMTGNRGAAPNQTGSYCVAITGATIPTVDLRDNIFYTTQTSGGGANAKSYVIGTQASVAALGNLSSDYNVLTTNGSNAVPFRTGGLDATGTDFTTFPAWQAATGEDSNSIVDNPEFVSPLDNLRLTCDSQVQNAGIPLATVPNDYDGQARNTLDPDPGADEFVGPAASVGSLKVHGGSGSIVLGLPSGTPAIESRSGGVNGNFEIVFNFPSAVSVDGALVVAGVGSDTSLTGQGTSEITVTLTGVTNAQYLTLRLRCVTDGVLTGDVDATFGVLLGDTNGNGTVSATDIAQTKSRSGQSADPSNFRSDVVVSGTINASDIGQIKSASGTGLP